MNVLVGLLAGAVAARLAWALLRPAMGAPVFARANYRGHTLPTAAGVAVAAAVLLVEAVKAVGGSVGIGDAPVLTTARTLTVLAVAGFTLLGLTDDLGAVGAARGFRGHLRSIASGSVSTGGLKLLGGGLLALVLAGPAGRLGGEGTGVMALGRLLADGALIALAANLANLFDRAPGRVIKVTTVCFVALVVPVALQRSVSVLGGPAVVVGAGLGLLAEDLRERCMLGDTGANALGATLGLGAVLVAAPWVRLVLLAVLLVLNVLSERVSFSRVIDSTAPLRALDRWGATAERRAR